LNYALLASLWPRWSTILWAVVLAGGIEATQVFIPARFAGITDIIIAAIGAWFGCTVAKANTSAADFREESRDYPQK
jgi:VanZ family protein